MNHQEVFIKASKLGIPIYSKPTSFMAKVTIMDEDEVPETPDTPENPDIPENPDTPVNTTLPPLHKNITVSNNVQLKDGKYGIFKNDTVEWKVKLVDVAMDSIVGESKLSLTNTTDSTATEEILNFVGMEASVTTQFTSAATYRLKLSIPNVDEVNWEVEVKDVVTPSTATIQQVEGEVNKELDLNVTINDTENKWENVKLFVTVPSTPDKQLLGENITTGTYKYTPTVEGTYNFSLENNNEVIYQLSVNVIPQTVVPQPVFSINVEKLTLNPVNQSNMQFRVTTENGNTKYNDLTMFVVITADGNTDLRVDTVQLDGVSDIDYALTKSGEHVFKIIGTLSDSSGTEEVWRESIQVADVPQPTITSTVAENEHFRVTTTKSFVDGAVKVPAGTEVDYRIIALSEVAKNNITGDSNYYKIVTAEGEQVLVFDEITGDTKAARVVYQYNNQGQSTSSISSTADGQVITWNMNII